MTEVWKELIPESVVSNGISLAPIGLNGTAWPISCAESVVSALRDSGFAILGGDIYLKEASFFVPAYENWSSEIANGEQWPAYVMRSCNEAVRFLLHHGLRPSWWFTVVATSKPSAHELATSYAR